MELGQQEDVVSLQAVSGLAGSPTLEQLLAVLRAAG